MKVRKGLIGFIAIFQSVLFLTHFFLYQTWIFSATGTDVAGASWVGLGLGILSVSFLVASLLAFRYTNSILRTFYRAAAVWLGLLTFVFLAAVSSWIVFGVARLAGLNVNFHRIVEVLFGAALVTGFYGVFNASWTRITRTTVRLANLPEAWRGRRAALISDVHLGHVRNGSFLRRMVAKILKEEPDLIFIAGDLFDGTAIDAARAAEPLNGLTAPHGVFFVAGNHEQFGDDSKYLRAVSAAGVRVLSNEKVESDGLQIIGVPYRNATQDGHLASVLDRVGVTVLLFVYDKNSEYWSTCYLWNDATRHIHALPQGCARSYTDILDGIRSCYLGIWLCGVRFKCGCNNPTDPTACDSFLAGGGLIHGYCHDGVQLVAED